MIDWPFFCSYGVKRLFWFRIFGLGLLIKDSRTNPPLYSERNRLGSYRLRVGFFVFTLLLPWGHQ